MKTTSFNNQIIKIGKILYIGTESRHSYNGVKHFVIDLFSRNVLTVKFK